MDDHLDKSGDEQPEDFLQDLLKGLLGEEAGEEAARALQSQGFSFPGAVGAGFPGGMAGAINQFKFLADSSTDPVNWRVVEDIARQNAYQSGDPTLSAATAGRATQAMQIADLWLDTVTDFTVHPSEREAWTRVRWIEKTLPAWKEIFNPIAQNVSRSMSEAMQGQIGSEYGGDAPDGMEGMFQALNQMIPKMSAMSFGYQVGQALAAMAQSAFGASGTGFPLAQSGICALLPTNIAQFSEDIGEEFEVVQQYMAVREVAHARLFASVPWLEHDLHLAVLRYAAEIALDTDAIEEAARSIDPSDPESVNRAMSGGVFAAEPTHAQERALERLETLLSLIEGWIEVVTTRAVTPYLPESDKLREMLRRRRVSGSPAEDLLGQLVGLQVLPRQTRGAATIFNEMDQSEGSQARDAIWAHPDIIPTALDLDNPELYKAESMAEHADSAELDAELEKLLAGTLGWDEGVPEDSRGPAQPKDSGDDQDETE